MQSRVNIGHTDKGEVVFQVLLIYQPDEADRLAKGLVDAAKEARKCQPKIVVPFVPPVPTPIIPINN